MINTHDVDDLPAFVDPVDHPVRSATCGVVAVQPASERLADPVRVVPAGNLGLRRPDLVQRARRGQQIQGLLQRLVERIAAVRGERVTLE
jgi:hypothetical protein